MKKSKSSIPRLDAKLEESAEGFAATDGRAEGVVEEVDLVAMQVGKTKEGSELPANL